MAAIPTILEVSNYNGSSINDRVVFYFHNFLLHYAFDVGTSLKLACSAPESRIELNRWTHATFVFSRERNQIYINGVPQRTVCTDGSWKDIIGHVRDVPTSTIRGTNYFGRTAFIFRHSERIDLNGGLDEIRIYNNALPDDIVRSEFNNVSI